MVLEVREEDSDEFGLEFSKGSDAKNTLYGISALTPGETTFGWVKDTFTDPETGLKIFTPGTGKKLEIKALIDKGKAEVLSRPSVLAVSNRQAVIQVADVIQSPLLESTLSESGGLEISSYSFEQLLLGITLNLVPRVSADRQWLSLEIDATVESEDDENTGEVFAPTEDGESILLAEKAGSSRKKVRTFARIPDRTPIIIGGLVSKVKEEQESRVPFLSDIPILGNLFTSFDDEVQKREVIIVLTPYILDEAYTGIASQQPKTSITNRLSESILFENKYRLRTDDLFDLSFFENDPDFTEYRQKAIDLVTEYPELKKTSPFSDYVSGNIPGANHMINKMIFDVVSNSGLGTRVNTGKMYITQNDGSRRSLKSLIESVDSDNGILALQVENRGVEQQNGEGEIRIAVNRNSELLRLKNAIVANDIITLNGGYSGLELSSLHAGKELKIPNYSRVLEADLTQTALEIYMDSKNYYRSLVETVAHSYRELDSY